MSVKAQISPGELTKAHSSLEGMSNCTKCHELGESVTNSKCLGCHSEIKSLIQQGKGYHSSASVKGKDCFDCHSEHNGRDFKIIHFDPKNFDHKKTGYQLTGAHLNAECSDCHQSKLITSYISKKKSGTYLGLSRECKNCHEDIHQFRSKRDCSACHSTEKFKPAENFDHAKTQFVLTGMHQKVECSKCHQSVHQNGKKLQIFSVSKYSSCKSCHRDVHNNKFGNNCESCHNTSSFHSIAQSKFDHNKTAFPLIGKHRLTNCTNCHKTTLTEKIKHEMCIDCHKDYHNGEFLAVNRNRDCSECHSEIGFTPSKFTIEKHNTSKYILSGAHLAVSCKSCHSKNDAWFFRNIGTDCIDCHENIHGSELALKYLPENKCSSCHTNESWKIINFNHDITDFNLEGKHKNVSCINCHTLNNDGVRNIYFASTKSNCESCHMDIHFGQFVQSSGNYCFSCHSFENWKPDKFDHEKTKFSLKGAHSKIACIQCHKLITSGPNSFIKYKLEDFRCASCHI
ncbi:MAG: cytochrome C [Ignavibacteriaceae bacterium]|nr:cytochrome C [Ignavibacteriaceae bacterium]